MKQRQSNKPQHECHHVLHLRMSKRQLKYRLIKINETNSSQSINCSFLSVISNGHVSNFAFYAEPAEAAGPLQEDSQPLEALLLQEASPQELDSVAVGPDTAPNWPSSSRELWRRDSSRRPSWFCSTKDSRTTWRRCDLDSLLF